MIKKDFSVSIFLFLLFSVFNSCSTGLGEELDLEAPVLTIKSLTSNDSVIDDLSVGGGIYCKKSVTFAGTVTDNRSVKNVYIERKKSTESSFTNIGNAKLSGSDWTFSIDFETEGSYFLRFVAEDAAKNYSVKSSRTLTLFVDESAPVANAWYIDREQRGIRYNFKSKENLESLDLTLPENKDASQNVCFTICANASDTYGINDISVMIKDEDGNIVANIENSNKENNYAPKFKVTEKLLVDGDKNLASGKHYLNVFYNAEDVVENIAQEVELGWFVWWPESDEPQIVNPAVQSDENGFFYMNAYINNTLNFTFFDDDAISEGYFALLTDSEARAFVSGKSDDEIWTSIKKNPEIIIDAATGDSEKIRTAHFKATSERETTVVLSVCSEPQTMRLFAVGYDGTSARKTVTKDISVKVTDDSTPILLITSPKDNSIPVMLDGKVTVEGITLDKAGCTYLEFVWVPDSLEKSLAKTYLDSISTDSAHEVLAKAKDRITTTTSGVKVWSVSLKPEDDNNGFKKHSFSFDLNLMEDFTYNDKNEKDLDKYFLVKLTRKDGKSIYNEYSLLKDDLPPVINSVSPISDMQIIQEEQDFTLKFSAEKDSGLEIDTSSYKIERIDVTLSETISNSTSGYSNVGFNNESKCYEAIISSDLLKEMNEKGIKPKYRFYARDIFGNEGFEQFTLVISDLPALQRISSSSATRYKKGDKIDIVASFSKAVQINTINKKPRLKLKGITNSKLGVSANDEVYAEYASGSGSTSIHFVYIVKDGDSSDGLTLFDDSPLDDNGSSSFTNDKVIIGKLSASENAAKNDFDSKAIKVDGILPSGTIEISAVVSSASTTTQSASTTTQSGSTTASGGSTTASSGSSDTTYLKEGSTITATLTMNESVIVESPTPSILFTTMGGDKIELPFSNISGSGASTKLVFSKTIGSGDANGRLYYNSSSYIANVSSISDSFGNKMELSASSSSVDAKIYIDTNAPKTPKLNVIEPNGKTLQNNGKYKDSVKFSLSKAETDETIKSLEYSVDGGSSWKTADADKEVTLDRQVSFTYRAVDFAGNVSEIPDPIYLDIENSFPNFSVECINPDGNYKAGSILTLRVYFDRKVNVAQSAAAYINIVGGNATLSSSAAQTGVYSVDFTYTVKDLDNFKLNVAEDAVNLSGITDEYGFSQGGKKLSSAYKRNINCDGITPTVTDMTHTNNIVTLTFNKDVLKSGGNITLRRAGDWAIPPVLSAANFNKIVNAYPAGKETLSLQENGKDMEDSEWVNGSDGNYKNEFYHGTGQFVGPYKKTTQGILDNGEPDISTKYVLDFDMDIWEKDTPHYYGKTFNPSENANSSSSGTVKIYVYSEFQPRIWVWQDKNNITGNDWNDRPTMSTATDLHDNTNWYVYEIDESQYTKGESFSFKLTQIDKDDGNDIKTSKTQTFWYNNTTGSFYDVDPSLFSKDPRELNSGNATKITANQIREVLKKAGYDKRVVDVTSSNVSISGNTVKITFPKGLCDEKDDLPKGIDWELVIDENCFMDVSGNYSKSYTKEFTSEGVSVPVVRVDRYSYGLGIYQSDSSGNKTTYISNDDKKPTGYVRVRIDCETSGATVKYGRKDADASSQSSLKKDGPTSSYTPRVAITKNTLISESVDKTYSNIFAAGNGDYKTSARQYIVAQATKNNTTSEKGYEAVFQTVVKFVEPKQADGELALCNKNDTYDDFSIRGTTGWSGEPYISPFPLRDAQIGSPFLRLCYKEKASNSYFWISYEILVDTSFSGHGRGGNDVWSYAPGWGWVTPGGYCECSNMKLQF